MKGQVEKLRRAARPGVHWGAPLPSARGVPDAGVLGCGCGLMPGCWKCGCGLMVVRGCGHAGVRRRGCAETRRCGGAGVRRRGGAETRGCGNAGVRCCSGAARVLRCGFPDFRASGFPGFRCATTPLAVGIPHAEHRRCMHHSSGAVAHAPLWGTCGAKHNSGGALALCTAAAGLWCWAPVQWGDGARNRRRGKQGRDAERHSAEAQGHVRSGDVAWEQGVAHP